MKLIYSVCSFSMDKQQVRLIFVILVCVPITCLAQYRIPEVTFEAFMPKGLRISIPADQGVELFAFHGKVNKPILQTQPGDISQDVIKSVDGRFTYVDPNIKLKVNDQINYWVYVQHDQLGFRKDDQTWKVDRLLPIELLQRGVTSGSCSTPSATIVENRKQKICPGDEIINYKFSDNIDPNIWVTEQYIPGDPDWSFNIYQNTPAVVAIEDKVLRIRPKFSEEDAKNNINLNPGCTRKEEKECIRNFFSIWNPPVVSGKLQSISAFSFGNITIRAKLPIGDYIFPEIYLQDIANPRKRILIAYARGNQNYQQNDGTDDGGNKLFGGPYSDVREPTKSKYLSTYLNTEHVGASWHTFNLLWKSDEIDLFIDGTHFGHHEWATLRATGFDNASVRLVLGVGAGGPFEFPDGYTSSGQKKPYRSSDRNSIKQFVTNKASWLNTWNKDSQLQVDYVLISAL